jgi:5-(carboxyamino)imidazole ribonucleotide synthase
MRLQPGAVIGILGGGQLGRMLALAAADLGFDAHIYSDTADSPAARVAARAQIGAYDDGTALTAFAAGVDVVTFEFENVPAATAGALIAAGKIVRPPALALAVAQDRVAEKQFFQAHGVATTQFAAINTLEELAPALERIGAPAILKTRRMGYDGKGQARLNNAQDAATAFAAIGSGGAILEKVAPFTCEVSVILARGHDGEIKAFDISENRHRDGMLAATHVPAMISAAQANAALEATARIAAALDYVGVLAVEFFVMADGTVLANEMAPRVHNSGHWTPEACITGQFEQHIRAIAGWPLGDSTRFADVVMENVIGEDVSHWLAMAQEPASRLRLYGKRDGRPGRKMGHLVRLLPFHASGGA